MALFNASEDTIDMLEHLLRREGFHTVDGRVVDVERGVTDFPAFIAEHNTQVIRHHSRGASATLVTAW